MAQLLLPLFHKGSIEIGNNIRHFHPYFYTTKMNYFIKKKFITSLEYQFLSAIT